MLLLLTAKEVNTNTTNVAFLAKSFLAYVNDKTVSDDFTEEVDAVVAELKRDSEVRRQYMFWEMALHDERMEGRAEGIAAKTRAVALDMLKDKMSLPLILKYSRLRKEEIYALAQENNLQVVE